MKQIRGGFDACRRPSIPFSDLILFKLGLGREVPESRRVLFDQCAAQPWTRLESCARQVFFGLASDVDTGMLTPHLDPDNGVELLRGKDAYTFALQLITGLLSDRVDETHVVDQIAEKYAAFKDAHPHAAARLDPFFTQLRSDGRQIRAGVLDEIRAPRSHLIARELTGGLHKEAILAVVVHAKGGVKMDDTARGVITAFGNRRANRVAKIVCMAPEEDQVEALKYCIRRNRQSLKWESDFEVVGPSCMAETLFESDAFITTAPMGSAFDELLRAAWQEDTRKPGSMLVHLGEGEIPQTKSTAPWLELQAQIGRGIFLTEDVAALREARDRKNKELQAQAQGLLTSLVDRRMAKAERSALPAPRTLTPEAAFA